MITSTIVVKFFISKVTKGDVTKWRKQTDSREGERVEERGEGGGKASTYVCRGGQKDDGKTRKECNESDRARTTSQIVWINAALGSF